MFPLHSQCLLCNITRWRGRVHGRCVDAIRPQRSGSNAVTATIFTHFATQTKQTESILINKHKYRVNSFILQKVTNHKLQTECELAAYDSAGADSLVLALQNLKPHACLFCQSTNNHVHVTRRKRVTPEYACRGKNEIRMNRALTMGECWV